MKKHLLFKILLILSFIIHCQFSIINSFAQAHTVYECNFDNWTDGKPDGWEITPAGVTVSQYPAYSGLYACKLEHATSITIKTTETFPIYWGKKYVLSFTIKLLKGYTGTDSRWFPITSIVHSSNPDPPYFDDIKDYFEQNIEMPVDDVWRDYEIEFVSKCDDLDAPISSFGNNISIKIMNIPDSEGVEFVIDRIKLVAVDRTMEFDYLETNNIKAYIEPLIPFMNNPSFNINYFEAPKSSKKSTIFSSTIFLAGLDNEEQLHVAAHKYCQDGRDFQMGPVTTDYEVVEDTLTNLSYKVYSDAYIQKYYYTWKVTKAEINYHRAHYKDQNYVMPWGIANWPAHGRIDFGEPPYLAPYKKVGGKIFYDPTLGDYPDIRGDEAVFFIINDAMEEHTETGGTPFNFDIYGMAYAFNSSNPALQNTLFLSYELLNKSTNDYKNLYFGLYTDFDIGNYRDDYAGCDTLLNLGYAYNGKEIDGNGEDWAYGENPPAQGAIFLNQKMSAFVCPNNNYSTGDPQGAADYYNLLQAKWKDGTHLTYGGNGYDKNSTDYTNYMFSGDPINKTGWTEYTPYGQGSEPNIPTDRRGLMSSGPYSLPAGGRLRLDIAYPFARDNAGIGNLSSVALLKEYSKEIQEYFNENIVGINEHNIATGKLLVYPNPSNGQFTLSSEKAIECITVYDLLGKVVYESTPKAQTTQLNTHLPQGLYIYRAVLENHSVCSGKIVVQ
jgi:hypothetical protein